MEEQKKNIKNDYKTLKIRLIKSKFPFITAMVVPYKKIQYHAFNNSIKIARKNTITLEKRSKKT